MSPDCLLAFQQQEDFPTLYHIHSLLLSLFSSFFELLYFDQPEKFILVIIIVTVFNDHAVLLIKNFHLRIIIHP